LKNKKFFKSLKTLDGIAQLGILVFGVSAIILISCKISNGEFSLQPFFILQAGFLESIIGFFRISKS